MKNPGGYIKAGRVSLLPSRHGEASERSKASQRATGSLQAAVKREHTGATVLGSNYDLEVCLPRYAQQLYANLLHASQVMEALVSRGMDLLLKALGMTNDHGSRLGFGMMRSSCQAKVTPQSVRFMEPCFFRAPCLPAGASCKSAVDVPASHDAAMIDLQL